MENEVSLYKLVNLLLDRNIEPISIKDGFYIPINNDIEKVVRIRRRYVSLFKDEYYLEYKNITEYLKNKQKDYIYNKIIEIYNNKEIKFQKENHQELLKLFGNEILK